MQQSTETTSSEARAAAEATEAQLAAQRAAFFEAPSIQLYKWLLERINNELEHIIRLDDPAVDGDEDVSEKVRRATTITIRFTEVMEEVKLVKQAYDRMSECRDLIAKKTLGLFPAPPSPKTTARVDHNEKSDRNKKDGRSNLQIERDLKLSVTTTLVSYYRGLHQEGRWIHSVSDDNLERTIQEAKDRAATTVLNLLRRKIFDKNGHPIAGADASIIECARSSRVPENVQAHIDMKASALVDELNDEFKKDFDKMAAQYTEEAEASISSTTTA